MASVVPTKGADGPSLRQEDKQESTRHLDGTHIRPSNEGLHDRLRLRRVHSTSEHALHFIFTHRAVACLWCLILTIQLLNGLQLMGFSYVYMSYAAEDMSVLQYLASEFLQAPQQAYLAQYGVWIGVVYATLGSVFLLSTISMVVGTIWARELRFDWPITRILARNLSRLAEKVGFHRSVCSGSTSMKRLQGQSSVQAVESVFIHAYRRLQVWWIACGVRGEYFERTMLLREAIELFYQAIQADQVSRKISHKYINYAYTTLIAVNALLHPLLSRMYVDNLPMKRFAVVFSDFFQDFVWGCLLPMWMFWPFLQLDTSKPVLLVERGFGFIENAQREVEQIVILSWSALLLSVLPFVSAILSLRSVKKLLKGAKRINSWSEVTPEERIRSFNMVPAVSSRRLAMVGGIPTADAAPQSKPVQSLVLTRGHTLLSLCGAVVTLIAILSSGVFINQPASAFRVWTEACKFPLTPWFATRQACAVWYVNCTQMGTRGNASELDRALSLVDAKSLVYLSFDSCARVEMPTTISQFTNLRALAFWSSTLETWSKELAISTQNFPALQTLLFQNVTLTSELRRIRGFVAGTWPARVEKAIFINMDLSQLRISEAATTWQLLHGWYCVQCGLVEFPGALFHGAQLRELTIQGTALKSIPSPRAVTFGSPLWPHLKILHVDNNYNFTNLPEEVWGLLAAGSLQQLHVGGTNLTSIPSQWIPKLPSTPAIFATNSTLCRDQDLRRRVPALVCDGPG